MKTGDASVGGQNARSGLRVRTTHSRFCTTHNGEKEAAKSTQRYDGGSIRIQAWIGYDVKSSGDQGVSRTTCVTIGICTVSASVVIMYVYVQYCRLVIFVRLQVQSNKK